jgi:hypothetical protein
MLLRMLHSASIQSVYRPLLRATVADIVWRDAHLAMAANSTSLRRIFCFASTTTGHLQLRIRRVVPRWKTNFPHYQQFSHLFKSHCSLLLADFLDVEKNERGQLRERLCPAETGNIVSQARS